MSRVDACPACGGRALSPVWRVASVPVHSCLLLDSEAQARAFPRGELDLRFCEDCGFLFNAAFDPACQHYSPAYEETQAFSPRFLRFLAELCEDQARKYALSDRLVLEIGCGKGEFLLALSERTGCRGIGVDPGFRPERLASPALSRLTFVRDFYGPHWASLAPDYLACRHTLEHIGPVAEFLAAIRATLGDRPDTVVMFELPDLRRILLERAFWDLYYEHASYFTAGSLARLFRRTGFSVHALWRCYDDQYLVLEARPSRTADGPLPPLAEDLEETRALVAAFRTGVATKIERLRARLAAWRGKGETIAIWGSGSKAVAFLAVLGLGAEIALLVDVNPHKWGRYVAGTGHRIASPEELAALRPDVVLVMNPIYTEEIGRALAARGLSPLLVPMR
ncbi:MAG: class I SAM-dependent methyltransferase [Geminicoccaceae bacterium]|nr:class I SAM-dependent methyltransferase [Geminicoccaceae bacterium]MDW8341113.1 class I SAM-dependent methyltransferase [Geminicoccaceae bacterium]